MCRTLVHKSRSVMSQITFNNIGALFFLFSFRPQVDSPQVVSSRRDIAANKINAINKMEFTANFVKCILLTANKSQNTHCKPKSNCTLQTKSNCTLQTKSNYTLQTKTNCTLQTKIQLHTANKNTTANKEHKRRCVVTIKRPLL